MELPPLSLYLHLPWCVRKCPYCDFNSHKASANLPRRRYVNAVLEDLAREAEHAGEREIVSVFLGGGTPSLFAPAEIATILQDGLGHYQLADDCEVTMEANPGTIEHGRLAGYRQAGVNRLSIGAQSFAPGMLSVLGRIHGPEDILAAHSEAVAAGFDSINIDLMYALPGQDVAAALADIETLLLLAPPHVSWYQLTLEPNTIFHARPPEGLPDDELCWEIQTAGTALLESAGYVQYEISAFAKPGHRCRHNLNYWTFGDYLACGAGAHGKLTDQDGFVRRYEKPANPLLYMERIEAGPAASTATPVAADDLAFEFMLNSLRMQDGFLEADFERRTGLPMAAVMKPLLAAQADGIIARHDGGRWQPTARGFRFLNELQARFLP